MQRAARMKKEMQLFLSSPPHGISCWTKGDSIEELEAQIIGSEDTPYEGGIFKLEIQIPERYPFEPPKVRFVTPIYHPNIDNAGRICLDSLKMPPKGAWKPALNISTLLTTVQLLMNEPNPDDPLMTDISSEFKYEKAVFIEKAKDWTRQHATSGNGLNKENSTDEEKLGKATTENTTSRKRTTPLGEIHSSKQQKSETK